MLCGIDEAGRGCLAGPLVVAGVILLEDIDGIDDSKKLTPKSREQLYEKITQKSRYKIVTTDNKTIDEIGLSKAIKLSLEKIVAGLKATETIFDGNTTFGVENIRSMIKADTKVKEVAAASILAKVTRDRYMINIDREFPQYGFAKHKGYGTKDHIKMIEKYGYSKLHRMSFKIKSFQKTLF